MTQTITLQGGKQLVIRLVIERWLFPEVPGDSSDAEWLQARVEIVAGGFQGAFPFLVRRVELAHLEGQLSKAYRELKGEVIFHPLENQLDLVLKVDLRGHFVGTAEAQDVAGIGNRLLFDLDIDQTRIAPCLEDLRAFLLAYPRRT